MTEEDLLAGIPTEPPGGSDEKPLTMDDLLAGVPIASQGQTESTTATRAALRAAGEGLGPGAAAAAAFTPGAETGAAVGAMIPVLGETGIGEAGGALIGGVVSSALAAGGAAWAQHKAAQLIAPETTKKFDELSATDAAQHPVAGAVGRIASALPMFELAPFQSVKGVAALWKAARGVALDDAEKEAAKATTAQVGLGTGSAVVQPLMFGESPTKQGIVEAFIQSLILGAPRHEIFGKPQVEQVAKEEAARDEQQANPNPTENPESLYQTPQPPALTPDERAALSQLAFKAATGAKIEPEDALTHRLMVDNDAARKEFNDQKSAWAQALTHQVASAAFGDAKNGEVEFAGGEMPNQTGFEHPDNTSTPAELATESAPAPKPQDVSETVLPAENAATPAEDTSVTPVVGKPWEKFQGDPETLLNLVHNSAAPVVEKGDGSATAGVKAAQLYREIRPGDDPLSAPVMDALFKTARAEGDSRLASQKRIVMLSPDGTHVTVSTPGEVQRTAPSGKKIWVKSVASYNEIGKISNRPYSDLYHEGWRPLAAIKTDETAKSEVKTYSLQQWNEIRAHIVDEVQSRLHDAQSGVAEMPEQGATEIVGSEDLDVGQRGHVASTPNAPVFSPERQPQVIALDPSDLEHLVSVIGEAKWKTDEEANAHINRTLAKAKPEVVQRLVTQLSPRDANSSDIDIETGYKRLQQHIIDSYAKSSSPESLAETLTKFGRNSKHAGMEEVSSGTPGQARNEADNDARRSESPAGSAGGPSGIAAGGGANAESSAAERPTATESGATGEPKAAGKSGESPAAANAAGIVAKPQASKIEVVTVRDGLPPKEIDRLHAIAEKLAEAEGHEEREHIEAEAEHILTEGIPVKVDGRAALLYEGQIHTSDGKALPVPDGLLDRVARNRTSQASDEVARLAPAKAKTAEVAQAAVRGLRALGVRVDVAIDALARHYGSGEYKAILNGKGNATDVVTWHVADAHDPTPENLVALFHEAGHAVFARLPPEVQAAALRAIRRFTDETLGISGFKEAVAASVPLRERPWVEQEGRLVESVGRKLVEQGFNPNDAAGWAQRIWRAISDVAHGVYLALAKLAGYPPSDERALAYFQHRLQMALRGEKPMTLLNFLGGPRLKLPDWSVAGVANRRFSGINPVTNPRRYLETREGAPVGIAALNDFKQVGLDIIHQWDITGNVAGLPDEQVARQFLKLPESVGGSDMFVNGATPASLVADAAKQHGGGVSPLTTIKDLQSDVARQRAQAVTHRLLAETKAVMDGAALEAHTEWNRGVHQLEQNNNKLVRLTKDFVDVDYMSAVSKKAMVDLIADEARVVRGVREFSDQEGAIGQVLRQLDQTIQKGDLPAPYKTALDEVYRILVDPHGGGPQGLNFTEILHHIGTMDIDWKMPTGVLKEALRQHYLANQSPYLKPLLGDNAKSRALLATTISFAKSNSHMVDLLALRADKSDERAQAGKMLQDLLNASEHNLGDLRQRVVDTFKNLKMRDRMLRIADKIAELRKNNYDLMAANERNKAMVDFHKDAFTPLMTDRMNAIEKDLGIVMNNFEVYHGAPLSIPTARDAAPDKFVTRQLSLRSDIGKRGERPTPTPEVTGWLNAMRDWLEHKENTKYGAKYNEVADVVAKLESHFVADMHLNLQGSAATRLLGPLQEKCNQAGTPSARLAGQAFNRYSSLLRAKTRDVVQRGTAFAAALNDARMAAGYPAASEKTFWDNVISPALHDLEQNGERIWASGATREERINRAVSQALQYMNQNGKLPARANVAVEKMLRLHVANCDSMVTNGKELGLKVLDQGGASRTGHDYRIYRSVLGEAPTTLPRALTDIAANFYREHMSAWGGTSLKAKEVAPRYQQDPNQLRQFLQSRFTPQVWDWFMRSLAYNDRPHFYAPNEGGLAPLATRENVINAYETAQGDVVRFAENLAVAHGFKPDGAFVGETLDTIQNFHNLLRTMAGDEAEAVRGGSPAPKRYIVDARHVEAAPKEWLTYLMSDQYNMERIIHGQAFQAAFGRNGAGMEANLATAINEQRRAASTHEAWRAAIQQENPGLTEKKLQALIKAKCDAEGVSYTGLRQARRNLSTLNEVSQHFSNLKGMNNSGRIPELLPWARLMRTIGGWTVSGAGTAITAHSVFLEQPSRLLGLSGRSVIMTARSVADLAKVLANSMLQAMGHQCIFEADRMLAANEAGLFDPLNSNQQRFVTAWMHANAAYHESGAVGRGVGRLADVGGAALQTDLFAPGARAKALARQANGQAVAPTIKPLSPFHWIAESLQISNFITWQRHIEGLVAQGAKYLKDHPELADDKNLKLTRQMVGGGFGDREFRFLTQRMNDFGFSLEQLVRSAVKNKGSGKPMLSDEVNKAIQQLTLNEITLESSLTSRMPVLQTNGLGVAMNPFLGWPLQKTYQVLRQLREPNGEATRRAFIGGLAAYAAILPLGMAAAWLRNKFDEDVLGRKQNVSDLGTIHDVPSSIMTALDNASRIGTFGFIGEGANYFLSDDNVRPLSLDSRVFVLNTIENTAKAMQALYHQTGPQIMAGNLEGAAASATDYQTVLRPLFQTLGGNGLLQNLGALNHILALDDAEARVSNRISVNNYLRVAGRELNLDVRTFAGMMQNQSAPNPIKLFVGQMVLAAYANNHEAFTKALRMARQQAVAEGLKPEEAMKKVIAMYEAQNPVKLVFKSLTESEYQRVLAQLPDNGKQSVSQALRLYQHYGGQIGANASLFSRNKADGLASTIEDMRRGAVAGAAWPAGA
jgi:hypothetical protein